MVTLKVFIAVSKTEKYMSVFSKVLSINDLFTLKQRKSNYLR